MMKNEDLVIPKETEYSISINWPSRDNPNSTFDFSVYAKSRSKARYKAYEHCHMQELIEGIVYSEFQNWKMSIKIVGKPTLKSLFGDSERLKATCEYRGVEFVNLGMKVHLTGQGLGYVIGSNSSSNLDVYFIEKDEEQNCHPYWELDYFNDDNEIIKSYKKKSA